MDELERAGARVRAAIAVDSGPSDRVRARARAIVRNRRLLAAGSIMSVVIVASVGVAIAARRGNGLGIHTIGPARSSTTDVRPTVPTTTSPRRDGVNLQPLPMMAFADARHGWRVEPVNRRVLEHTTDGGHIWTAAPIQIPGEDMSLTGVVAIDDRHVFTIVVNGIGNPIPRLVRTTDGVRWQQTRGIGIPERANALFVSFVDATHGWAATELGDLMTTADGGDHWHPMKQPELPQSAGSICMEAPGVGWAATGQHVYLTDDSGATWHKQLTIPVGGGSGISMVCNGAHAAYASFSVGAGQHIGAFMRTDDAGAHWRALTEDTAAGVTTVTAPGFPDNQSRGDPIAMQADGTLLFSTGSSATGQNWIVTASPTNQFVVGKFDSTRTQQLVFVGAAQVDAAHVFAEVQTIPGDGTGPRPVALHASSDGGHTWQLRWTGQ